MAEMIFVNYVIGQRAVTVVCPKCGRFTRLALKEPLEAPEYAPRQKLLCGIYTCPVCSEKYEYVTSRGSENWSNAYSRYMISEELYNENAKKHYQDQKTERSVRGEGTTMSANTEITQSSIIEESFVNAAKTIKGRTRKASPLGRKLENWKKELLDTGKRNKMINYRETKRSTLRILEPSAKDLFNHLAFSEKPLSFQKPIDKQSDIRTFSMLALLETLSFSLPAYKGDIKAAGAISERERTLKNLRAKAKLAQEEQGTNILYLSFGFIVWRNGTDFMRSPLLMMPVTITQKSLNAPFLLTKNDDDIEVNPTLDYLFNAEFGIDLPPFELKNRDSFEEYMSAIEKVVDKRGWRLVREVSLGLLSFLKINMYHDLNEHQTIIENHPVLQAMAGNETAFPQLPAEVQNYDFDKASPNDWFEVVDADSSQEEAILLSRLGVSFVLQGPPGTGKSQTITNIIADSLANGKKVLFVSEKAAALQVVLKRLREVHLDDFCLSLHDYKANKKEIVHNIGANLDLEPERASRGLLNDLVELQNDRTFLSKYATELHEVIQPLDESIYSVLGKLTKLDRAENIPVVIENIDTASDADLANWLYHVGMLERALHKMEGTLCANPWNGTSAKSYSIAFQNEMAAAAKGLPDNLGELDDQLKELFELSLYPLVRTWNGIRKDLLSLKRVLSLPIFPAAWLDKEKINQLLSMAEDEKQNCQDTQCHYEKTLELLSLIDNEWTIPLLKNSLDEILLIKNAAAADGGIIGEELKKRNELLQKAKKTAETLNDYYEEATQLLRFDESENVPNIVRTSNLIRLISNAPYMEAMWFDIRRTGELNSAVIEIEAHQNSIREQREKLLAEWEPGIFELDAKGMLGRFKTEYSGLLYKLKSNYKEDIRTAKLLSKTIRKSLTEAEIVAMLQAVVALDEEKRWFTEAAPKMNTIFGSSYCGTETNPVQIREGIRAAVEIANQFPYASVPINVIEVAQKASSELQLGAAMRRLSDLLSIERITKCGDELIAAGYEENFTAESTALKKASLWMEEQSATLSGHLGILAELEAAKRDNTIRHDDIQTLVLQITQLMAESKCLEEKYADRLHGMLDEDQPSSIAMMIEKAQRISETCLSSRNTDHEEEFSRAFGECYKGTQTDWAEIIAHLNEVRDYLDIDYREAHLPFVKLICNDSSVRSTLNIRLGAVEFLYNGTADKMAYFCKLFPNNGLENMRLREVADKYSACISDFLSLNKWIEYEDAKAHCDENGLKDFTSRIEKADNTISNIKDAFEKGFYIAWLSSVIDRHPSVQQFKKGIHEAKLASFEKLDRKQFDFSTNRIRRKLIAGFPNVNDYVLRPEIAILQREMAKKMRIKPLRRLFGEIPKLLLTLKPCLMMSPLSVAYFLNAENYQFDTVIFDEASQIFPQDAIGSIFRAKQVIIAGDTKQLPPTNFFSSSSGIASDEYDTDDDYEEEVYDSILEETASVLPSKMLLWHYRSKHEHLIAFSNQEMYDNRLVTFPNSSTREPDTGVEYVYVEDGCYESKPRNCNIEEAKKCVELVRTHIEKYPNRSLGIIAFSEKQQQAIMLEIQRFREKNPKYEPFFEEGKEDEFFVKNLENVQGDERDTIIFSIGYAKTKAQKMQGKGMSMNFGPLTKQGGERRLNVAITRAKLNVKLVGSIMPSDIDLSRTESEGVRMLRSYIEFARNGEVSLASANRKPIQDDFVDMIFKYLEERGYKVKKHVGCSGYKIDIVVENPNYEGEYAAGIECDGVVYASAKTARDRDRLRKTVLTNMGWKLYRVWSTEWMTNPELEAKNLISFIDYAIIASNQRVKRLEEERSRIEAQRRAAEEQQRQEEARKEMERQEEEARKQRAKEQRALARRLEGQAQRDADRKALNERKRVKRSSEDKSGLSLFSQLDTAGESIADNTPRGTSPQVDASASPVQVVLDQFHVGDAVRHTAYGPGAVVDVKNEREVKDGKIVVRFSDGVEKTFNAVVVRNGYLKRLV